MLMELILYVCLYWVSLLVLVRLHTVLIYMEQSLKLMVALLVMKPPSSYGTQKFIIVFTPFWHWTLS